MSLTAKQIKLAETLAPHITSDRDIHREVERRHGKCDFAALCRVVTSARR